MNKINGVKKRKGFSLMELIIAVAIIGILTAVAVPMYINAKDSANRSAYDSNCNAIKAAMTIYVADNSDKLKTELFKDNAIEFDLTVEANGKLINLDKPLKDKPKSGCVYLLKYDATSKQYSIFCKYAGEDDSKAYTYVFFKD